MRKNRIRVIVPKFWAVPGRQKGLKPGSTPPVAAPAEPEIELAASEPESIAPEDPQEPTKPSKSRHRRLPASGPRCDHCNSRELRRQPESFGYSLLMRGKYQCARCNSYQTRVQFSWTAPLLLTVLATIGGAGYVVWSSSWFRQLDSVQALSQARAPGGGQLSAFEEMMVRRPKSTLTNASVVELAKAGVRNEVIIRLIRASNADYDLRANAIIELKRNNVDESVILAMIDQSYGNNR